MLLVMGFQEVSTPATLKMLGIPRGASLPGPVQPYSWLGPETIKLITDNEECVMLNYIVASNIWTTLNRCITMLHTFSCKNTGNTSVTNLLVLWEKKGLIQEMKVWTFAWKVEEFWRFYQYHYLLLVYKLSLGCFCCILIEQFCCLKQRSSDYFCC